METETEAIDYVGALTEASIIYEAVRMGVKIEKGKQVAALGKYGIFTHYEISYLLDTKGSVVHNAAQRYGVSVPYHDRGVHGQVLNGGHVEAVKILANQFHNHMNISFSLLRLVCNNGLDKMSIVRLTGIPEPIMKGVLSGGSYLSGVFRARP